MTRRWTIITLLTVAGLASAQSEPAPTGVTARRIVNAFPQKVLDLTAEGFRTHDTAHFVIRCSVADELLEPLIAPMEETYVAAARFAKEFGPAERPPTEPLAVVFFEDFDAYCRCADRFDLCGASAAGFYDRTTTVSVFVNAANSPLMLDVRRELKRIETKLEQTQRFADPSQERLLRAQLAELRTQRDRAVLHFNRFVLRHEIAHQVLYNLGVHRRDRYYPMWLTEGLACQFEESWTEPPNKLPVNPARLADVRDSLGASAKPIDDVRAAWVRAVAKGQWAPLADLVTSDAGFIAPGVKPSWRYAQSWALVRHLCEHNPDAFKKYLRILATRPADKAMTGSEALEVFESAFGPITPEMEFALVESVLRLPFVEPKVEE